ncbi:hypothetical protein [Streptomyces spectabilis]|uniref:Uncharacterized protein n=1 Tax=Streptomyces spectabilis TaxID=68270 RepID=A0A7W8AMD4_STRST|nr:hypothetical protein [Streptomyces spectabilis]MBB5101109.1 hypothetical protein [Streptomyces spectabilis]
MADDPRSQDSTARQGRRRPWAREVPPEAAEAIVGVLQLLGGVAIKIAQVPRPLQLKKLTFDEVVRYFVEERPDVPQVHHGALLTRQGLSYGFPCLQVFVDRDNKPCLQPSGEPYGRFMVARELDGELRGMFGGRELIIFE